MRTVLIGSLFLLTTLGCAKEEHGLRLEDFVRSYCRALERHLSIERIPDGPRLIEAAEEAKHVVFVSMELCWKARADRGDKIDTLVREAIEAVGWISTAHLEDPETLPSRLRESVAKARSALHRINALPITVR